AREVSVDLSRAAALRLYEGDLVDRFGRQLSPAFQELCSAEDRLQGVVQLVRHARDEYAHRGQPLLADDLALQRLQRLPDLALLFELSIERIVRFAEIRS